MSARKEPEHDLVGEPVTATGQGRPDPGRGPDPVVGSANGVAADSDTAGQPDTVAAPEDVGELTATLQRLGAEYANYRRRVERDRHRTLEAGKASVITELLGILDDLDRARAHGDLEQGPLRAVADKLTTTLSAQGVAAFGAEGEEFDPTRHEAVAHEGAGSDPVVATVARRGYQLGNRVLRTALVTVTDRAPGAEPIPNTEDAQRGPEQAPGADHCAEHAAPQEQETPRGR